MLIFQFAITFAFDYQLFFEKSHCAFSNHQLIHFDNCKAYFAKVLCSFALEYVFKLGFCFEHMHLWQTPSQ
jgi:hypothetical protein